METILVIIALIVYVGMLIHAYICEGDIECLSDIAYDKHWWLFLSAMTIIALCMFIASVGKTPDEWSCLVMLSSIGCVGIGTTPYKAEGMLILHKTFAIVGMLSVCALWIVQGGWWMPFLFCLAGLRKKWLLGVELGIMAAAFAYALI